MHAHYCYLNYNHHHLTIRLISVPAWLSGFCHLYFQLCHKPLESFGRLECSYCSKRWVLIDNIKSVFFIYHGLVAQWSSINAFNRGAWCQLNVEIIGWKNSKDSQSNLAFRGIFWNQLFPNWQVCT